MKILSLFDGMACGAIAFTKLGLPIDRYVAYEIDKYAVKVASHNFPFIEQRGDVFQADFTEFNDFDFVIGGSPCTYWSIAQKNNRETEASGLGWELFSQYVRAVHEAKPKYFIYENNKSMSKEIKASITEAFGFEPVLINSALVSAQNRQRLYWVGRRNEDGTYSKVDVEQPEDRGILLRDVLDSGFDLTSNEKAYCLTKSYNPCAWNTIERSQRNMVAEPLSTATGEKAFCIDASYYKGANPAYSLEKHKRQLVAEPVDFANRPESSCERITRKTQQADAKSRTLTASSWKGIESDGMPVVAEPVRIGCYPSPDGTLKNSQGMRLYDIDGKSVNLTAQGGGMGAKTGLYAVPIESEELGPYVQRKIGEIVDKYGYLPERFNPYNCSEITEKSPTLTAAMCRQTSSASVFSVIASDGKTHPVYEVLNGLITIKDKQYPIKLADGFYIIRKLTVSECMRLQTVPEWYDFSAISNSQAYKCLGNGWTVDVITHLIQSTQKNAPTESQLR